jgi:hypothetical protein
MLIHVLVPEITYNYNAAMKREKLMQVERTIGVSPK